MTLYRIRRSHLICGALFVFSYVFFLLALLPASFVAERLPLPKIVQLNNVQGTIWQGEIGEIRWQQQTLHHVRWKVLWSRLLLGMPALRLTLKDPQLLTGTMDLGWRGDGFIDGLKLRMPVSVIQSFLPAPLPVGLAGTVDLAISQLQINPHHCDQLQGTLTWQQGSLSTPLGDIALGSPQAVLACQNDKFTAEIKQDSDELSSQSSVRLNMQGRYQVQSTLTAGRNLPEPLRSSLSFVGKDIGNGIYKVKEEGSL